MEIRWSDGLDGCHVSLRLWSAIQAHKLAELSIIGEKAFETGAAGRLGTMMLMIRIVWREPKAYEETLNKRCSTREHGYC